MFVFRKIWRALFSWNVRFEIRPFALLPTNHQKPVIKNQTVSGFHQIQERRMLVYYNFLLCEWINALTCKYWGFPVGKNLFKDDSNSNISRPRIMSCFLQAAQFPITPFWNLLGFDFSWQENQSDSRKQLDSIPWYICQLQPFNT